MTPHKLTHVDINTETFPPQHGSSGETQMLQTAFSETVQDLIDLYLAKQDSIPAFLSSVTLQLLGSRTMCVD